MKCKHDDCENEVARSRRECNACRKRSWRKANPARAVYLCIKESARKRGIPFTLTLDALLAEVAGTPYLSRRGRASGDLHLDRINPVWGYEPGNVRVVLARDNVAKGNSERWTVYPPDPPYAKPKGKLCPF